MPQIAMKKDAPNPPLLVYKTDMTIEPITLTKNITIEECWKLLGGYLEKFQTDGIYYYFADEEGLLKKLPPNPRFQNIVGTVLAIPKRWFH